MENLVGMLFVVVFFFFWAAACLLLPVLACKWCGTLVCTSHDRQTDIVGGRFLAGVFLNRIACTWKSSFVFFCCTCTEKTSEEIS